SAAVLPPPLRACGEGPYLTIMTAPAPSVLCRVLICCRQSAGLGVLGHGSHTHSASAQTPCASFHKASPRKRSHIPLEVRAGQVRLSAQARQLALLFSRWRSLIRSRNHEDHSSPRPDRATARPKMAVLASRLIIEVRFGQVYFDHERFTRS